MNDQVYVLTVNDDAVPGKMHGPFNYNEGCEVLLASLVKGDNCNGPVAITDEIKSAVELDGYFEFDGGGGIYLVACEDFTTQEEDDEEAEEQDRRDHKNGLYGEEI